MQQSEVMQVLKEYISQEILDGKDIGLEATTPLLEWGIIDSLSFLRLINFIQDRFGLEIAPEKAVPDNFKDLEAMTSLVLETAAE
ncbi:MAG: acyl carrier protein [Chloroflexota bacterium]